MSVHDPVLKFFPEYATESPAEKFQSLTIQDLLTMRSGHLEEQLDILKGDNWAKRFLQTELIKQPGTYFAYNTLGTYMLAAILQKVTGQTLLEYLKPRLLDPLGCSEDLTWETSPEGICAGGFGIAGRLEDIARFCTFVLHRGKWQGRQLLQEAWFEEATLSHAENAFASPLKDWQQGYGYQFWHCVPEHVFRGDGAFGQLGIVLPDQDMVIAFHSGCANDDEIQVLFDLLWEQILPFIDEELEMEEEGRAQDALERYVARLTLPTYFEASEHLNLQAPGTTYQLEKNPYGIETVAFQETAVNDYEMILQKGKQVVRIPLDSREWVRSRIPWLAEELRPQCRSFSELDGCGAEIAVRAGMAQDELWIDLAFLGTPFQDSWKICFCNSKMICTM